MFTTGLHTWWTTSLSLPIWRRGSGGFLWGGLVDLKYLGVLVGEHRTETMLRVASGHASIQTPRFPLDGGFFVFFRGYCGPSLLIFVVLVVEGPFKSRVFE